MIAVERLFLGSALVVSLAAPALAQEPRSAALAKQLAAAMDGAKQTAIAAADPAKADYFVAALSYPGSLLVVEAKYQPAVLLTEKLAKHEYQDVYVDLQSASVAGTKLFITDTGADGLKVKSPDSADRGDKSLAFDGEWKKSKLSSEQEYNKALIDAEEDYARMLTALMNAVKKTS